MPNSALNRLQTKVKETKAKIPAWEPLPGPQTHALESEADIVFYGGAAGGGKTDLLVGAALKHRRSIIFRREYTQLSAIIDRGIDIYAKYGKFNAQKYFWRLTGNRKVELGSCKDPGDEQKYQGQAHDLKAFDEIGHFTESQFRTIIGWLRSPDPNQRCRVLATGNPPLNPEEEWIVQFFAPWLDPDHPNPAKPGELRYYAMLDGVETEVMSGTTFGHIDKKTGKSYLIRPLSRTFIPASVTDNPYYMASGYMSQLASLPEPLRSKLLYGDFTAGKEANPWQCIPTEWIKLAQDRWKKRVAERGKPTTPMTALGCDVARGGKDKNIFSPWYDNFMDEQIVTPGIDTPDGPHVAALIVPIVANNKNTRVNIDVIGVGSSPYDCTKAHHEQTFAMNGAEGTEARDKSGQLGFVNQRAQWHWQFREALDPNSGQDICLPPDRDLLIDLSTPHWRLTARGILIESKDDIIKRIKRSPDKGDSCIYGHAIKYFEGAGMLEYYRREAEAKEQAARDNKK